jgi:hypothetical protein
MESVGTLKKGLYQNDVMKLARTGGVPNSHNPQPTILVHNNTYQTC